MKKIHKLERHISALLREGTIPQRTRFVILESFKQMRNMMTLLEQRIEDDSMTDEDFDNAMSGLEAKIKQIKTRLSSHITGR